ncbi:hypothetical protein MMC09_002453 [Bachmanniomyces sp. S44760]|nr:hypothetical protein [Bachmanniomyces sp. S44760]
MSRPLENVNTETPLSGVAGAHINLHDPTYSSHTEIEDVGLDKDLELDIYYDTQPEKTSTTDQDHNLEMEESEHEGAAFSGDRESGNRPSMDEDRHTDQYQPSHGTSGQIDATEHGKMSSTAHSPDGFSKLLHTDFDDDLGSDPQSSELDESSNAYQDEYTGSEFDDQIQYAPDVNPTVGQASSSENDFFSGDDNTGNDLGQVSNKPKASGGQNEVPGSKFPNQIEHDWSFTEGQNTQLGLDEIFEDIFDESTDRENSSPILDHSGHDTSDISDISITNERPTSSIIGYKVAAIVEDRPLGHLIPLILHFAKVLGPEWPILFFTNNHYDADTTRMLIEKNISLKPLPPGTSFPDHQSVSQFMTRPWIWEQLAPAEKVLIFQGDSVICERARQHVDDYLNYDFIGAPIVGGHGLGSGYNGGLSLRNRRMTIDILKHNSWRRETEPPPGETRNPGEETVKMVEGANIVVEDQWYYLKMKQLPRKANGEPGANLPSYDVAMTFSVETVFYQFPLGYHQPFKWPRDRSQQVQLERWCPDVFLTQ